MQIEQPRRGAKRQNPSQSPSSDTSGFKKMAAQALKIMTSQVKRDEYSAFGEYVVSELRSIPPVRAAHVKRKLNHALINLMEEVDSMVSVIKLY